MPPTAAWIAAAVLAGTFAWAAAAKVARWGPWRVALASYRLPRNVEIAARPAVPVAEGAVVALVATGAAQAGAALAIALLSCFSLAVLRARALGGDRLPCGCFGRDRARDYRAIVARNALVGAVAAIVLLGPDARAPQGEALAPAALVAVGCAAAAWTAVAATAALRKRP